MFTFGSPTEDVRVVPVKLDLMEFTPGKSEEELMFPDWGHVEGYGFVMPMFCGHEGLHLLGDLVKGFSGDGLEEEGFGSFGGGEFVGRDDPGVDKVSHGAGVYKG